MAQCRGNHVLIQGNCAGCDFSIVKAGLGEPQDIWHPDFGWVLKQGQPTKTSQDFLKWLMTR